MFLSSSRFNCFGYSSAGNAIGLIVSDFGTTCIFGKVYQVSQPNQRISERRGRSAPTLHYCNHPMKNWPNSLTRSITMLVVALYVVTFGSAKLVAQETWQTAHGATYATGQGQADCSSCSNSPAMYVNYNAPNDGRSVASTFNRYCIRCHGVDGRGVSDYPGIPDFTNPAWQASRSDEQLARLTYEGRGALMPAFRGTLTKTESFQMAQYIRRFAYQSGSQPQSMPSFPVTAAAPTAQTLQPTTPHAYQPAASQTSQTTPEYTNVTPKCTSQGCTPPQINPQTEPSVSVGIPATNLPTPTTTAPPVTSSPTPVAPYSPFDNFIAPTEINSPQTNEFLNGTFDVPTNRKLPVISGPQDEIFIVRPPNSSSSYPATINGNDYQVPNPTPTPTMQPARTTIQPTPTPVVQPVPAMQPTPAIPPAPTQPAFDGFPNFELQAPNGSAFPEPAQSSLEPPTNETFMPFQLTAPQSGTNQQMSFNRPLPSVGRKPKLLPVYPETTRSSFIKFSAEYPMSGR